MKKRTRKVLSLLLAASMVFTMNTIAFAEEAVDVEAAPAVDEVVEVVEDDAAVEADAAVEEDAAADADATVDEAEDAIVDDGEGATAAIPSDAYEGKDGIYYSNKDGKPVTKISYTSNGDKKNPKNNIVTIDGTTNPTSWNNIYARDLMYTVLCGSDTDDTWLNNSVTVTVSQNKDAGIPELRIAPDNFYFDEAIEVGTDAYLLVGYALNGGERAYVDGFDNVWKVREDGFETIDKIPVIEWDGRTVVYNKSGNHKSTTSNIEALDVYVSLVTYNNGTVTELKGVEPGTVKIDKNAKKASVAVTKVSENHSVATKAKTENGKTTYEKVDGYHHSYATLGDLPTFTIKPKAQGNEVKSYKKEITNKMKDRKYTFGIRQKGVKVAFETNGTNTPLNNALTKLKYAVDTDDKGNVVLSDNLIKDDKNKTGAEYDITDELIKGTWRDTNVDDVNFGTDNANTFEGGKFTISKFKGDKAKATLVMNVKTNNGKGKVTNATVALKEKKDFTLESATVGGTSVQRLEFVDGGNYAYYTNDEDYVATNTITDPTTGDWGIADLGIVGYSFAFRQDPTDSKSKKFRYGVVGPKDNTGFVYEAQ